LIRESSQDKGDSYKALKAIGLSGSELAVYVYLNLMETGNLSKPSNLVGNGN